MAEEGYLPRDKAQEVDNLLTAITGKDRKQTITSGKCVMCDNPDTNFRDDLFSEGVHDLWHVSEVSGQDLRRGR